MQHLLVIDLLDGTLCESIYFICFEAIPNISLKQAPEIPVKLFGSWVLVRLQILLYCLKVKFLLDYKIKVTITKFGI